MYYIEIAIQNPFRVYYLPLEHFVVVNQGTTWGLVPWGICAPVHFKIQNELEDCSLWVRGCGKRTAH